MGRQVSRYEREWRRGELDALKKELEEREWEMRQRSEEITAMRLKLKEEWAELREWAKAERERIMRGE